MTTRGLKTGIRAPARWLAIATLASACAVGLAACEENSAPPSSEPAAAAPAQGPADLMGAPQGAQPPAEAGPPVDGVPPPGYPPAEYPPPGATPYGPGAPGPYPPAPPSEVIAMAPIPNPAEEPHHRRHWRVWTHGHHGWWGPVYAAPGGTPHHHHRAPATPQAHAAAANAHHGAVAATAPATPQLPKPKAPHSHAAGPDAGTVAAATGGANSTSGNTTENVTGAESNTSGAAAPEDQRYDALQSDLAALFGRAAVLNVPKHLQPGVPADITLTVPGDFAQTLRTEAAKQNLSDQAATANLEATLMGEGYTIVPTEAQSLPVTLGAPTVFHWKATPQGATQGALHADVRAILLGANHPLALGAIKAGGGATGRLIGVGLLVLIALVLLGWVMRNRRPAASGATRPRTNHQSNNEPPTL